MRLFAASLPCAALVLVVCLASAGAQTVSPARPGSPAQTAPAPGGPATTQAAAPTAVPAIPTFPVETPPSEAVLGVPMYPTAQFIRSYDAGRGQRFYLYGSPASFPEVVAYYRTILKQRGELVFERPATHAFEIGRFRAETMAFPPGVTVKDFTGTPSAGFPNPKRGTAPERFPTIIQIVPAVPQAPR